MLGFIFAISIGKYEKKALNFAIHVLRFILFVQNSELFKISITKWNLPREKKTLNFLEGHTLMKNNKLNFIYILHYMLYSYKPEPLPPMRTFFSLFFWILHYILLTRKRSFDAFFSGSPTT